MYLFSMAIETNYYKLGGLRNIFVLFYSSGVKSQNFFHWAGIKLLLGLYCILLYKVTVRGPGDQGLDIFEGHYPACLRGDCVLCIN